MEQLLYLEIPTPDTATVRQWLQQQWQPPRGTKSLTPDGIRLQWAGRASELSAFVWSLQRTSYLKLFRWGRDRLPGEGAIRAQLERACRERFPLRHPELPAIEGSPSNIFEALAPHYPQTVHFFRQMPNGERDLERVYWWERRWRARVRQPEAPQQAITHRPQPEASEPPPPYDLIYVGGALGVIHAAIMARLGYRVLLVERLPFGRMNREWNISRGELQSLIDLGLFDADELEAAIAREYEDGFSKFFDGNVPPALQAQVLRTPNVLNVALDAEKLLRQCGDKLRQAGGEIWDETDFLQAEVGADRVAVQLQHRPTQARHQASGRLLVDAMGSASPIAWQLNGGRAFDSVCPTVGAVIAEGIDATVWDSRYGDVLNSHGDISRGRQLIWELFPGAGSELAVYLFHYHQPHPDNPGSLLALYEDFFTILPEYRRCDLEALRWKKPTFGYIPGHFSTGGRDRQVACDRVLALGDAASLQSPLVFTGFGSLVRNLPRLTALLDTALRHELLEARHLNRIRAYQVNVAVTWLFSKGMMVPTGARLPPARINAMLNTFFGLLAREPPGVADAFIKDRADWATFNRLALKAAFRNPALLRWIWEQAGARDLRRWLGSYLNFTREAAVGWFVRLWLPRWLRRNRAWLERRSPGLWLRLLSWGYAVTTGLGHPQRLVEPPRPSGRNAQRAE